MVSQIMVRRLALGSPYSKPSTAEDGLQHPAIRRRFTGLHEVSIAAAHYLRNAAIGLRTASRFTLCLLAIGLNPLERRNRAPDVAPVIAMLAANRLQ
jgi:hypothetical protein